MIIMIIIIIIFIQFKSQKALDKVAVFLQFYLIFI